MPRTKKRKREQDQSRGPHKKRRPGVPQQLDQHDQPRQSIEQPPRPRLRGKRRRADNDGSYATDTSVGSSHDSDLHGGDEDGRGGQETKTTTRGQTARRGRGRGRSRSNCRRSRSSKRPASPTTRRTATPATPTRPTACSPILTTSASRSVGSPRTRHSGAPRRKRHLTTASNSWTGPSSRRPLLLLCRRRRRPSRLHPSCSQSRSHGPSRSWSQGRRPSSRPNRSFRPSRSPSPSRGRLQSSQKGGRARPPHTLLGGPRGSPPNRPPPSRPAPATASLSVGRKGLGPSRDTPGRGCRLFLPPSVFLFLNPMEI